MVRQRFEDMKWILEVVETSTEGYAAVKSVEHLELILRLGRNCNRCFAPDGVDSTLGVSRPIESRCDLCFKLKITSCLNWCAIV